MTQSQYRFLNIPFSQVVLLILGCFSICWLPYFITIIIERAYNFDTHILYEATFTLAMSNSGMNPLIYAWKNTNFRKAFWCLLRCRSLKGHNYRNSFITNHVPSKKVNIELRCGNRTPREEDNRKCSIFTNFTNVETLPRRE